MTRQLNAGLIALAGITALALWTYYSAGEFTIVKPQYDGSCLAVYGIPGAEDATVHPGMSIAFISSYDRRLYRAGLNAPGAIFSLDVSAKNPVPKSLTENFNQEFHPHGISLYIDPAGKTFLFAINHRKIGDSVEIFEYTNSALEHRESIKDPMMWRANDLQAVGLRSFYVSNDHGSHSAFGRFFEDFIPLKQSYVLYFDGKALGYAVKNIGQANGINMSADGKTIYIAATTEKAIRVYGRQANSGDLTLKSIIPIKGFPDNIEVDDSGNLYVASMPKGLTYLAHSRDGDKLSPTQIFKIARVGKSDYKVDELYADDGRIINAATVAAPFRGGMLLGPSKDLRNHVLICTEHVKSPT